jgi:hypothetical protein
MKRIAKRNGHETCRVHNIKSTAVPIKLINTEYIEEAERPTAVKTADDEAVSVGIVN